MPVKMKYRGISTDDPGYYYAPYNPFDSLDYIVSGCTRKHNGGKELKTLD